MNDELIYVIASAGSILFLTWHMARQEKQIRELKEQLSALSRRHRTLAENLEEANKQIRSLNLDIGVILDEISKMKKHLKRKEDGENNERRRRRAVRDIGNPEYHDGE